MESPESLRDTYAPRVSPALIDNHPEPLNIVIVGAGIGGLSAAIGLRRNGHRVVVFEQSRLNSEPGAAVHIMPNANGILRRWGIFAEEFGGCANSRVVELAHDGRLITDMTLLTSNQRWAHPWLLSQRSALHGKLNDVATDPCGPGFPVVVKRSSRVLSVDTHTGTVNLEDGSLLTADVILGSDGINSVTRQALTDSKVHPTGQAAFRFQISRRAALEDEVSRNAAVAEGTICTWYAADRRVVMYPCDNNTILNFVCIHPENESHATPSKGWNTKASIDQMLRVYESFEPSLKAMMKKADPSLVRVWRLLDLDEIPWVGGRLALLGDAAHPFTPHQGQGAGMAIEDAACLSVVLPGGAGPMCVPERLKLYERIRRNRAHKIQALSREAGQKWVLGQSRIDNTDFNFGHDELDHSLIQFKKWIRFCQPKCFLQMPIGFGPAPGPLQDGYGRPRVPQQGAPRNFTTLSIRFKTSRTFLETLLPTEKFQFRRPDTMCIASWSITSLDGLPWLSGDGYSTMALFVHGVRYRKDDGTVVNGAYMPVMFESLPDAVVTGREQLALPKFGCDISLQHRANCCRASASWRGATFVDLTLQNLVDDEPQSEAGAVFGESNILTYRYVPALGEPGKADAEYACVVSHADEGRVQGASVINYVSRSKTAFIKCSAMDWETLPTLHHIASALADMPVYGVINAKLVEGTAATDVPSCRRIE